MDYNEIVSDEEYCIKCGKEIIEVGHDGKYELCNDCLRELKMARSEDE